MSHLTREEIAQFKTRLEQMREQLTRAVHHSSQEVKTPEESTGYSQHQADQGTDDFDRTISLELTTGKFHLLRQVERALEKIEESTYGICDVTGDAIPKKRLDAIPYANVTRDVQERIEQGRL